MMNNVTAAAHAFSRGVKMLGSGLTWAQARWGWQRSALT